MLLRRLQLLEEAVVDDPENPNMQLQVSNIEKALEAALPKVEMQTSELQKQLEALQEQVENGTKQIAKKREWISREVDKARKACIKICEGFHEKNAKIADLKAQIQMRATTAPQNVPLPSQTIAKPFHEANQFVEATRAGIEANVRARQTELSDNGKTLLDAVGPALESIRELCRRRGFYFF